MTGMEEGADPVDLAKQLRAAADRLMSGPTGHRPAGLPAPPATLSAQQLQAVLDDVAARRAQVKALQTQLGAFDEQLGTLEANLTPLLEWAGAWAGVESAMTDFWWLPRPK
jgi:outer membrane protein TolC